MLDHRIRRAINTHAHQAGVAHGVALKETLMARAKELAKAKTPPAEIIVALGVKPCE